MKKMYKKVKGSKSDAMEDRMEAMHGKKKAKGKFKGKTPFHKALGK